MQDNRVARRYAQAIYEIAVKYSVVDSVEDDLTSFSSTIENDPLVRKFFFAPYMSKQEKIKFIEDHFSDRITVSTLELIRLMLSKGRERELVAVPEEFRKLRREHSGTIRVQVTSAISLTDKQKSALIVKLEKSTGRKVEAEYEVEKSLIGGIKVAYNNSVLDATVLGSLQRLRDQFRHNVLIQA